MTDFLKLPHLTQIRRLRALAEEALKRYPIRVKEIHFINHGENTTFRVVARGGKQYMLRIHREHYHTKAGIEEELAWLAHIREKTPLHAPAPVRSRKGHFLEQVAIPSIPTPRYCCLFHWVEGRFIFKSTTGAHMRELGQLMAGLHASSRGRKVQHRRYWHADGLLGKEAKFGSIAALEGAKPADMRLIDSTRKEILDYLRKFERRFPERQGLIHADLHFGNFLIGENGVGAIDFDDSGFGFHAYDLAIPLTHLAYLCEQKKKSLRDYADALQEGYAKHGRWDAHDAKALPYLFTARRLLMLGWMQSRLEIPDVKKRFRKAIARNAKFLRTNWREF